MAIMVSYDSKLSKLLRATWFKRRAIALYTGIIMFLSYFTFIYILEMNVVQKFNRTDSCEDVNSKQNNSNFLYGLQSLELLGQVLPPDILSVYEEDIPSLRHPETWSDSGDGIYSVDGDWWYISVNTPMPGVSGDIIRRWFKYVNCTAKYSWWHPRDHIYGIKRSESVDRVIEKLGEQYVRLDLMFLDPCKTVDCAVLKGMNVNTVIAGEIMSHDLGVGLVHIGHVLHILTTQPDISTTISANQGTEHKSNDFSAPITAYNPGHMTNSTLHTKYWLGKNPQAVSFNKGTLFRKLYDWSVGYMKLWYLTDEIMRRAYVHTKEEMFVLGRLLATGVVP